MGITKSPEEKLVTDPLVLEHLCEQEEASGKRVVLAMGAFDLLHYGHVAFLHHITKLGDFLVIGVNDDVSIRTNQKVFTGREPGVTSSARPRGSKNRC